MAQLPWHEKKTPKKKIKPNGGEKKKKKIIHLTPPPPPPPMKIVKKEEMRWPQLSWYGVLKKKIHAPPLPSEHQGWNAGKGDCRHYHSHLGFSILMGRGFIKVGGWSREVPGEPLSHFFSRNLAGSLVRRLPPSSVAHGSLTQSLEPRGRPRSCQFKFGIYYVYT